MRVFCIAALVGLCILPAFGDSFKNVEFLGKTDGGKAKKESGHLIFDGTTIQFDHKSEELLDIKTSQVSHLVYERASKPRYAAGLLLAWPLLFTKSKQHFLTIQYRDGERGKYAVFHLDKSNYREILAAAEAATGQKVDRQEER